MSTGRRWSSPATGIVALMTVGVLLTGCIPMSPPDPTPPPTGDPGGAKVTFLLRLIGICAGVNEFVAQERQKTGSPPRPAAVADRLEGLIGAAVANAPVQDREKLDAMVNELIRLVQALRAADKANAKGEQREVAADKTLTKAVAAADKASHAYGMPEHLEDCRHEMQTTWEQLPPLPIAAQQMATAVVNGRIWVVGGLTNQGRASNRTFFYEPALENWVSGPDLPSPLNHAMAVAYRKQLVVIGGWVPIGDKVRGTTSGEVLTLEGERWGRLAALRHPRAAGGAAVVGDRIVVVGGEDRAPVATTEVFDGSTWHDGADIPVKGDHLAAVSDGRALYAIGGRAHLDPNHSTAALQRYDVGADRWSQAAAMSSPRGGLGAAYVNGRIYAVGGETVNSAQNVVESYDVAANAWTPAPALPDGRHGAGVAAVGGVLYTIGGATEAGHSGSTSAVVGLNLSATAAAQQAATATTGSSGGTADAALASCPKNDADLWACLSSARLRADGGLAIRYRTNFAPSHLQDPAYHHLHVFTARPDGRGGISPEPSAMQGAAAKPGSWVSLYRRGVNVIAADAETSGRGRPLNTSARLLCIRVASGYHSLAKDRAGGLRTGNCVRIRR